MSTPRADQWSTTLHDLWTAAMTAKNRAELSSRVSAALLSLPGVVAVATVDQDAKGRPDQALWATGDGQDAVLGEPADDLEQLVSRRSRPVLIESITGGGTFAGAARAAGGDSVVVTGFTVPSGEVVNLGVVFTGVAPASLVAYFTEVADIARRAVERLALESIAEEVQVRDALLAEASLQMDAVLDVAQTVQRIARMVVPAVAEGCLIYLAGAGTVTPVVGVHVDARRRWPAMMAGPQWSRLGELVTETMAGRSGVPGAVQELAPAAAATLGAPSLSITLLSARGRLLGAVVFLFDRADERLPDPLLLQDLTRRAGLAVDNAEQYEQRRRDVVTLQKHLLPTALSVIPGVQLAATYEVADEVLEVGGDFYDVVPQLGGGGAALIGDVCGRGVGAAALTGMARHTLSTLLLEGMSGQRALSRLNTVLRRDGSWRFVTCAVATFRPDPRGGLTVRVASAGHPAPLIVRASGGVVAARGGGVVLGVREPARIDCSRLRLAPGDTLLLFTDGLTEARDIDGAMFEDGALHRALDGLHTAPVTELVEELSRRAGEFRRTGTDDLAVLALRATETAQRSGSGDE